MDSDLVPENTRIKTIGNILRNCAEIFSKLGYSNTFAPPDQTGRQIIFENQIIGNEIALQLTVVRLYVSEKVNSKTYNLDCSLNPGQISPLQIQNRLIKNIKLQLIEAEDYHQLTLQIYFLQPLNYSSEDLIYRVKTERSPQGIKLVTGYPWLSPQAHVTDEVVLELVEKIGTL